MVADGQRCRAADAVQRLPDEPAEDLALAEIVHRKIIVGEPLLAEQLERGAVIGQHPARRADEQQTLLHIVGQHLQLFLLAGQLIHLRVDLRLEARDLSGEGLELRILFDDRFGVNAESLELLADAVCHPAADEIERRDQEQTGNNAHRDQLQNEPEIILCRHQQRIDQNTESKRQTHCGKQLDKQRFLHSVASVGSG